MQKTQKVKLVIIKIYRKLFQFEFIKNCIVLELYFILLLLNTNSQFLMKTKNGIQQDYDV